MIWPISSSLEPHNSTFKAECEARNLFLTTCVTSKGPFCLSAMVTSHCIPILPNEHLCERQHNLFICLPLSPRRSRNAELSIPFGGSIEKSTMQVFNPCSQNNPMLNRAGGAEEGNNKLCTLSLAGTRLFV